MQGTLCGGGVSPCSWQTPVVWRPPQSITHNMPILPGPSIDLYIGPNPYALSHEVAFRIFPIAHQYDMRVIVKYTEAAFESASKAAPLALWPSAPIASSQVPNHPGLIQWLALADAKQCAPLVESCLSQLLPSDSNDTIRRALASPHLCKLVDGLHSETKTDIMCKMAGLPLSYQLVSFLLRSVCWEIPRTGRKDRRYQGMRKNVVFMHPTPLSCPCTGKNARD